MSYIIYDSDGNQLDHLTQWDKNRILVVSVTGFDSPPTFHFYNAKSMHAIVMAPFAKNEDEYSVKVPNSLLTQPLNIAVAVYKTDTDTKEGVSKDIIRIPLYPRQRPVDWEATDDDEYISFAVLSIEAKILLDDFKDYGEEAREAATDAREAARVANAATDSISESISRIDTAVNDANAAVEAANRANDEAAAAVSSANAAVDAVQEAISDAESAADSANEAANSANRQLFYFSNLTASAKQLPYTSIPTAEVTGGSGNQPFNIEIGIPDDEKEVFVSTEAPSESEKIWIIPGQSYNGLRYKNNGQWSVLPTCGIEDVRTLLGSIIVENITIPASSFVLYETNDPEETAIKNLGYTYRAEKNVSGVTSNMIPYITFSIPSVDASGVTLLNEVCTYNGGFYIYASGLPGSKITILTAEFRKPPETYGA